MGRSLKDRASLYIAHKYSGLVEYEILWLLLRTRLEREPELFEVALTYMTLLQEFKVEQGYPDIFTSAPLIYAFMTGNDTRQYSKSGNEFVASFTPVVKLLIEKQVFQRSSLYYTFNKADKPNQARSFRLTPKFYQWFKNVLRREMEQGKLLSHMFSKVASKRTTQGDGWGHNISRVHPHLQTMYHKLQAATFVIDVEKVNDLLDITELIRDDSGVLHFSRMVSIRHGLSTIALTNTPQHHDKIHLQRSGRRHTKGGLQALPKEVRRAILKPNQAGHVLVDYDLDCCQLLLAAKELHAQKLIAKITAIVERGRGIWKAMNIPVSKTHLKKAVYALVFMCPKGRIVESVKNEMGDAAFTTEHLEQLISFLEDLYPLREKWKANNRQDSIIRHEGEKNELGLKFHLEEVGKHAFSGDQYAESYLPTYRKSPQSQYFAWKMQSREQFIITSLISTHVDYLIVCDCHDGFLLSIPKEEVHTATQAYRTFLKDNYGMYLKGEVWEDGQVIPVDEYVDNDEQSFVLPVPTFQSVVPAFTGGGV